MSYLMKKLMRDMRDLWPQFVSVFIMAFLALTIYSGMEGVWYGLLKQGEQYFEETNLADDWIYTKGTSTEKISQISELDGIASAGGSMTITADYDKNCDIRIMTLGNEKVLRPMIMTGSDQYEENGIWLSDSFAKEHSIKTGDTISIEWNTKEIQAEVKGTVLDSEFIYYTTSATEIVSDSYAHGYAFISEAQAKEWYGMLLYNEIRLKLEDGTDASQIKEKTKDILGEEQIAFREREDMNSIYQLYKESRQMKVLSRAYCTLFILLSILTMYTTMSRIVQKQRILTGTLKAIGFRSRTLLLHYAMYGIIVSTLGCISGCLLGKYVISRIIMNVKSKTLTMPVWQSQLSIFTFLLILCVILVCTFSAIWAASRSIREMPAETMRPETTFSKKMTSQNKFMIKRLSNEWLWVIRDISRNKTRYLMGVIGIIGSMALMMAGFGIKNSLDYSSSRVYGNVYSYNYRISGIWNEESQEKLRGTGSDIQWICESSGILENEDKNESCLISILGDGNYVTLENNHNQKLELPDEGAVISQKMADLLSVATGDTIRVTFLSGAKEFDIKIADIADIPAPQGIFLSKKAWENLGYAFEPTSALVNQADRADWDSYDILSLKEQKQDFSDYLKSLMIVFVMLITASLLLGFVILYNLGMLNYIERYREYATMKVLGFYLREIRSMSYKDWILTALPGWILGTTGGFFFLRFITGLISLKSFVFFTRLDVSKYLIITAICLLGSLGISLFINRKVDDIDMAGALKSVE